MDFLDEVLEEKKHKTHIKVFKIIAFVIATISLASALFFLNKHKKEKKYQPYCNFISDKIVKKDELNLKKVKNSWT